MPAVLRSHTFRAASDLLARVLELDTIQAFLIQDSYCIGLSHPVVDWLCVSRAWRDALGEIWGAIFRAGLSVQLSSATVQGLQWRIPSYLTELHLTLSSVESLPGDDRRWLGQLLALLPPGLQTLTLETVYVILEDPDAEVLAAGLPAGLRSLCLTSPRGGRMGDASTETLLQRCRELRSLDVMACWTPALRLPFAPQLRDLRLACCMRDPAAYSTLSTLPRRLDSLKLAFNDEEGNNLHKVDLLHTL